MPVAGICFQAMRKSLLVLCAAASIGVGIVAVANALAGPVGATKSTRAAAPSPATVKGRYETVSVAQWWLLESGPRGRSLVIEYRQGDSCAFPATATVRETSTAIRVALRQPVYLPGPGEGCLDDLKFSRLTVILHSAIAGRHVIQPDADGARPPVLGRRAAARSPRHRTLTCRRDSRPTTSRLSCDRSRSWHRGNASIPPSRPTGARDRCSPPLRWRRASLRSIRLAGAPQQDPRPAVALGLHPTATPAPEHGLVEAPVLASGDISSNRPDPESDTPARPVAAVTAASR